MRQQVIPVYQFDELTDRAKENARDWFRRTEAEFFGAHGEIYESCETAAKLLGIEFDTQDVPLHGGGKRNEPIIYWSLHVQGSGASFAGRYAYAKGSAKKMRAEFPQDTELHRIADALAELQKANGYGLTARMKPDGREVHSGAMQVEVFDRDGDYANEETTETVTELMRDFADWIYKGFEEEYDYRTSDEQVEEGIRANEYEFYEDGERAVVRGKVRTA